MTTNALSSSSLYDAYYYQHGCGPHPYTRNPGWLKFFADIAERLNQDFAPHTVLDAGCAMGFLVEGFRDRGVEAYGVDISEYAISLVREDIRPYCWVGSVIAPFPKKYDIITCIEVLEHMPKAEAEQAIANFCQSASSIVFSSSPYDYKEVTHFNVQPPEYWAEQFARHGFVRDVDFDASIISPWAVRFVKQSLSMPRLIRDYERRFWLNHKEAFDLRELNRDMRGQLSTLEAQLNDTQTHAQNLKIQLAESQQQLAKVEIQLAESQQQLAKLETLRHFPEAQAKLQSELDILQNRYTRVIQAYSALQIENQAIQQTISWQMLQHLWKMTARLAPVGSRREKFWRKIVTSLRQGSAEAQAGRPTTYLGQFIDYSRHYGYWAALKRSLEVIRALWEQRRRKIPSLSKSLETADNAFLPPTWVTPLKLRSHQSCADVVICIHNALDDVQRCLESVIRYTRMPYQLILVDDGSDDPTRRYVEKFAVEQGARLLRNDTAQGYTISANQGMHAATSEYVVFLNSDTLVTPEWLDRLIACADSDHQIGLVGPLSNTASWQSVPDIFNAQGDWAENELPTGLTPKDMALSIARDSVRVYPRVGFLNGFCLLIKRTIIEQIGEFDVKAFPYGYGEENDYCLRALQAGFQLAISDDVYIYHAQSRSYSHERRRLLSEQANQKLIAKHGDRLVTDGLQNTRYNRVLAGVRAHARVIVEREALITDGQRLWEGKRLLFILPIAEPGGGGNVVFQEALAMRRMGVDVRILNLSQFRPSFEAIYAELGLPLLYIDHPEEIGRFLPEYDAVIATFNQSVKWLESISASKTGSPRRAYYVQDFEPLFYKKDSIDYQTALSSYTAFHDLICLTKTEWNHAQVLEHTGTDCTIVGPSVDIDIYRARHRRDGDWPNRPLRVAAMIRPSTPRRQAELTMDVLGQLQRATRGTVEIILFGCSTNDPEFAKLPKDFVWRNAGVLNRIQLAMLLNEVDIFADFSEFQAMGLTALEAMACGVAVIVPNRGGASSFARPEINCLSADTSSGENCYSVLHRLVTNTELRQRLQFTALQDSAQYFPEKAAYKFLSRLFDR